MTNPSPLREKHAAHVEVAPAPDPAAERPGAATGHRAEDLTPEFLAYGPVDGLRCEIVATFGAPEAEYAALRRTAGLLDAPHRGTLVVRGADRRDLLNRLVTQELADLRAGAVRTSFLTNRKGRIEADLLIADLDDRTVISLDLHQAASVTAALEAFVFTEDVQITDESSSLHQFWLDGPEAAKLLGAEIAPDTVAEITVAAAPVIVARHDRIGDVGLTLVVPADAAAAIFDALDVRPVGWYTFNTARIEAGTPVFNVDFGTSNLPHETGLIGERVSFKKGCYPGQEIVARMEHLGKPKQMLTGLRMQTDRLPVAGDQVFAVEGDDDPIGVVTSSTLGPMLGAVAIALAMLRTADASEGDAVRVAAEGELVEATVADRHFWHAT